MSKHKSHKMQKNSLSAYYKYVRSGGRFTRHMAIIQLMLDGVERGDLQIMRDLGLRWPNDVRPRITELLKPEYGCALVFVRDKVDEESETKGRVTKIAAHKQLELFA